MEIDFSTAPVEPVATEPKKAEPAILTVEALNKAIRGTLERQFDLVWVKGELSNFKAHSSGHFYFCLKDSKAQIKATMFKGFNQRLKFRPADGMEVILRGRVTVYEPRGDYQINVELMEPVGAGALQQAFEQLKLKLKNEGLFDPTRKRPLPAFPKHIAIVTSPTGAAIRDMINVLSRRNRGVPVTLVPTVVQGANAAAQICEAMKKAWKLPNVDLIIVGRGGGSIEDMWCFNDETLARLIASSPIPVISAVGHEIDFTIADFVADLRAPTPSAAAELAVKNLGDVSDKIKKLTRMLVLAWNKVQHHRVSQIQIVSRRLVDPKKRLQDLIIRNDELIDRMLVGFMNQLKRRTYRVELLKSKLAPLMNHNLVESRGVLQKCAGLLNSLSPLQTIERGYAIVKKGEKIVKSVSEVSAKDEITVRVSDGWIFAETTSKKSIPEGEDHGL